MWIEERNGKYKYSERYKDPLTLKTKKVSVTLEKKNALLAEKILQEKIDHATGLADASFLTFSVLVDKYLAYQEKNTKQSTYRRDSYHCNTFKKMIGSDTLVNKLSARYIRECLDHTGKKNVTKNEYLKHLKALLNWGYRNDYIDDISYLNKLEPYKDDSKKKKVADKYLEEDEIGKLLSSMEKSNCITWIDLTRFLILSGLRIGEAIALNKSDIAQDVIHITKTYDTNNHIVTSPKTYESERDISIQSELADLLRTIKLHNRMNKITGKLLFSDNGNFIDYDSYRMFLRRHSQKALDRVITPHALRHTHASLLLANGMTIDEIARRLGHADSKVTREIYIHIMEKLAAKDRERIKNIKIL